MAFPQYTPGTLFNLIPKATALAASKHLGVIIDSRVIGSSFFPTPANWPLEFQIKAKGTGGATVAATNGLQVNFYHVPGVAPNTGSSSTIATGCAAGGTSITLATGGVAANDITQNAKIALFNLSTKLGEVVTVASGGVSGDTLTISATTNAYALNDLVFVITQTPSYQAALSMAVNTPNSTAFYLPTSLWFMDFQNLDATNAITCSSTLDLIPNYQ